MNVSENSDNTIFLYNASSNKPERKQNYIALPKDKIFDTAIQKQKMDKWASYDLSQSS